MKTISHVLVICLIFHFFTIDAQNRKKMTSSDINFVKKAINSEKARDTSFYEAKSASSLAHLIDVARMILKDDDSLQTLNSKLALSKKQIRTYVQRVIYHARSTKEKQKSSNQKDASQRKIDSDVKKENIQPQKQSRTLSKGKGKKRRTPKAQNTNRVAAASSSVAPADPYESHLWYAASKGNVQKVRNMLKTGADPDGANPGGDTPLTLAANNGHQQVIDLLIEHGADIDKPNFNLQTPLMFAIFGGHKHAAIQLIEAGADVNAVDKFGHDALYAANMRDMPDVVQALVDKGAHVRKQSVQQIITFEGPDNPMMQHIKALMEQPAAQSLFGHKKVDALLHQAMRQQESEKHEVDRKTIWDAAAENDWKKVARFISKMSINAPNRNGQTPLMIAAEKNNLDVLKKLIKAGANTEHNDKNGNTALHLAIMKGHITAAEQLIESGADVSKKNDDLQTPLHLAIKNGQEGVIQKLLQKGANPNAIDIEGYTPLMFATYLYYPTKNIIPILVAAGAQVNAQDDLGITSLMIAAARGFDDALFQLLDAGASVDDVDVLGNTALDYARTNDAIERLKAEAIQRNVLKRHADTPLMKAVKNNSFEEVKALVKNRADIDAMNERLETALSIAVRSNKDKIARFLITSGAHVNIPEQTGITPLMSAVIHGNIPLIKLLLENGADINAQDTYRGRTPLLWVVRMTQGGGKRKMVKQIPMNKAKKILNLLLKNGADPTQTDKKGLTPLCFAQVLGLQPLAQILMKQRHVLVYMQSFQHSYA